MNYFYKQKYLNRVSSHLKVARIRPASARYFTGNMYNGLYGGILNYIKIIKLGHNENKAKGLWSRVSQFG